MTFDVYWSPEGRRIATVDAKDNRSAIRNPRSQREGPALRHDADVPPSWSLRTLRGHMPINYALAKTEGPKLKAELTRAQKRGYVAVLNACKHAVSRWEVWGAWPDGSATWQRALDDAAFKEGKPSHRLEDLLRAAALADTSASGCDVRVRLELPAEAARKLAAMSPEDLQKLSEAAGVPIKSVTLVEDDGEDSSDRADRIDCGHL